MSPGWALQRLADLSLAALPVGKLPLRFALRVAIPFLNVVGEARTLADDYIDIGKLGPLTPNIALELRPVAFN